jgi:hypothetical protein
MPLHARTACGVTCIVLILGEMLAVDLGLADRPCLIECETFAFGRECRAREAGSHGRRHQHSRAQRIKFPHFPTSFDLIS